MAKSADAFRSIGEVATLIGVAPHVLRYWETQFPQLAPVKRADGRRYYRPDDIRLAAGLCEVMREDGMTARGAARLIAADKGAALRARGAARLQATADEPTPKSKPPRRERPAPKSKPASMPLFDGDVAPAGGIDQPALERPMTPPGSGAISVVAGDLDVQDFKEISNGGVAATSALPQIAALEADLAARMADQPPARLRNAADQLRAHLASLG